MAGLRTIQVDHRDLDSVEEAKAALGRAVESVHRNEPIRTPMSFAVELQDLRSSGNPEDRSLAQILETVRAIQHDMRRPPMPEGAHLKDLSELRLFVERLAETGRITSAEVFMLSTERTSLDHDNGVRHLVTRMTAPHGRPDLHIERPRNFKMDIDVV